MLDIFAFTLLQAGFALVIILGTGMFGADELQKSKEAVLRALQHIHSDATQNHQSVMHALTDVRVENAQVKSFDDVGPISNDLGVEVVGDLYWSLREQYQASGKKVSITQTLDDHEVVITVRKANGPVQV